MADLVERPHGIKLYRNDETGLLRKFSYRPRHGQWTLMHSVDPAPWRGKAELTERLRANADNYAATGLTHELCREAADRIAALEAEASKGERRGLERAAQMAEAHQFVWVNAEATTPAGRSYQLACREVASSIRDLIPEAPVRDAE